MWTTTTTTTKYAHCSPPLPSSPSRSNGMTIWEKPKCKALTAPRCHILTYILNLFYVNDISLIYVKRNNVIIYSPLYIQTGSGAHPASYSVRTKVLSWVCSGRGITLITRRRLPPGLRTVTPPKCFHGTTSPWMCRSLFIQTNSERSKIKMRRIRNSTYTKLTVNTSYSPHSSV